MHEETSETEKGMKRSRNREYSYTNVDIKIAKNALLH